MNAPTPYASTNDEWEEFFDEVPKIAQSLLNGAKSSIQIIETILNNAPQFLKILKKTVPEVTLQAVLTDG